MLCVAMATCLVLTITNYNICYGYRIPRVKAYKCHYRDIFKVVTYPRATSLYWGSCCCPASCIGPTVGMYLLTRACLLEIISPEAHRQGSGVDTTTLVSPGKVQCNHSHNVNTQSKARTDKNV